MNSKDTNKRFSNKWVSKWKRYREIKKRVNAHVSCMKNTLSDDLNTDFSDNELASQELYDESEGEFHSSKITQNLSLTRPRQSSSSHYFHIEVCQGTSSSFSQESASSDTEQLCQNTFDDDEEIWVEGNVSSAESDYDENFEVEIDNFALKLAEWVTTFGISHSAVNDLLSILRPFHVTLPKDVRTLLKTVRAYDIENIAGGSYYHFGISENVKKFLTLFPQSIENTAEVSLQINIDGLPLFKSSSKQFWPILGRLVKPCVTNPFIIGLYFGQQKPTDVSQYTHKLLEELDFLKQNGVTLSDDENEFQVPFSLSCIICDTPARAFIKCCKGHSGYFGCDKCSQRGVWKGKLTFPDTNAPRRTDVSFDEMLNAEHHLRPSPFQDHHIGMVSQFPLDYMHLVCLGVMKKLIWLWMNGPIANNCRIGARAVQSISESLIDLKRFLPREFNRKGRPLSEVERWKATEFRQFLMYTGPVVLKSHLSSAVYNHFLLLYVGIMCLSCDFLFEAYRNYAGEIVCLFVEQFGHFYGEDMIVYNVHALIHLAEDANNFGIIDNFSSFPFESFLGSLKRLIRKPNLALQQVIRRLSEGQNVCPNKPTVNNIIVKKPHRHGPVPRQYQGYQQFSEVHFSDCYISVHQGDNCIMIGENIGLVRNILAENEEAEKIIVYENFRTSNNFFTYPLQSMDLRVTKVSNLSGQLLASSASSIVFKCVLLPFHNKHIAFPMIHRFKRH